jgi:hypothetical protein
MVALLLAGFEAVVETSCDVMNLPLVCGPCAGTRSVSREDDMSPASIAQATTLAATRLAHRARELGIDRGHCSCD